MYITPVDTTGASQATANQDRLNIIGEKPPKNWLRMGRMENYKSMITNVGREKQMDPAVFAAIISRQSRAGATLEDGWGDHGYAFGLMQVDRRYHSPVATEILISFIKEIKAKFPMWSQEQ
uniref:Lysozyme g n=1 Tax=Cyprinus carpio TaxID=7962 RepID=A0A8C1LZH8_CYPCA